MELLPIGRRLAFDLAKGRLWVVCRSCERWNLTPLEERWEAIDDCERRFSSTKLKASTDQIGLVQLSEGLELVRVGAPTRHEFTAWRYGDQFGKRRRRRMVRVGATGVGLALYPLGAVVGISVIGAGVFYYMVADTVLTAYRDSRVAARAADPDGRQVILRNYQVRDAKFLPATSSQSWGLGFKALGPMRALPLLLARRNGPPAVELRGENALSVATKILPAINQDGGSEVDLTEALRVLGKEVDPVPVFDRASRMAKRSNWSAFEKRGTVANLPPQIRLALEIISHEHFERTALESDLRQLEAAWREAEEIAAIADDFFVPSSVAKRIAELRGSSGRA